MVIALMMATTVLAANSPLSPENHVYQYMVNKAFTVPKFETPSNIPAGFLFYPQKSNGYLWIPPACKRVRGIVVLGDNVPEQGLGGHPAIRRVCAEQDLAILFTSPSFRLSAVNAADKRILNDAQKAKYNIAFLQDILDELAKQSGYAEISTAPWFPIGESMSLQIVNQLTQYAPERCIAGIWVKDGPWGNATSSVPVMGACGSGAEWDFPKHDVFNYWREKATNDLQGCVAKRTTMPDWPGSLLIEAGSAHFSCTEAMVQIIAQYIRAAVVARCATDGSSALRPVDLKRGYVAGLPVIGSAPVKPKAYADCTPAERSLPWYFDKDLAQAAYDMASVNWNAQTQVPVFVDESGKVIPFNKRGITDFTPVLEPDGITFTAKATFLNQLPDDFVKGGSPLTHVAGEPTVEWLRGPIIPLGNNRFQLALDRSTALSGNEQRSFLRAIHPGDASYHLSVAPLSVHILINQTGKPQTITFDAIPDQKIGVKEVQLHATSDSGMPVRFFVVAGPAIVKNGNLELTPIPSRTRFPVTVTVTAWQWGRATAPQIQTAVPVAQSFHITENKASHG